MGLRYVNELVFFLFLSLLTNHTNKNDAVLCRDDGPAILKNKSGPEAKNLQK